MTEVRVRPRAPLMGTGPSAELAFTRALDRRAQFTNKRRAIVLGLEHILRMHGLDVCHTEYGRHLGQGLFEFRLRHNEAELQRRLHW